MSPQLDAPAGMEVHWRIGLIQAELLLQTGKWAEGWPLYAKFVWGDMFKALEINEWRGGSLQGKSILVVPVGGMGDQILFFRWFKKLKDAGAKVVYLCPAQVACLFEGHEWVDEIIPIEEDKDHMIHPERYDYYVVNQALPMRFKATVETIPWDGPYIRFSRRESRNPNVGFCARAGEYMDELRGRSMTPKQEAMVRSVRDFTELDDKKNASLKAWQDTAQVIANLDAVVTVDTAVMHLAGAMGKPVYVWPGRDPNWKFFGGRTDSPFYPSMKVCYETRELMEAAREF